MKAEQREVILSVDVSANPVYANIDSFHLGRALVNLIANAIDASDKNKIVSIGLNADKTIATIIISDNGSGMEKNVLEEIFVPFYTKKRDGTGLGLPIVKKIIEGHQGNIRISSKPGEGTKAVVELPAAREKQRI